MVNPSGDVMKGTDRYEGKTKDNSRRPPRNWVEEYDLVDTRSNLGKVIDSKQGTRGRPIALTTNYFGFECKSGFKLFHYRVDMKPDLEDTRQKKRVLGNIRNELPPFIFDGTMVFSMKPIYPHADKQFAEMTSFHSERGSDEKKPIGIRFRLVQEVNPKDPHYHQFYNILLRTCVEGLQMIQIGRNVYDLSSKKKVEGHPLEVLSGFTTSIRQHEDELLLCVQPQNKILRTDTVLMEINGMRQKRLSPEAIIKALMGSVVMTVYNGKTYRIDGINFNESPATTFEKGGQPITFKDYAEGRYGVKVTDMRQPVLISMPKDRDRRGGRPEQVKLLPEHCRMTGLSDAQRANFRLMTALGQFTRPPPEARMKTIMDFVRRLISTEPCREALGRWDMVLRPQMKEVGARISDREEVKFRGDRIFPFDQKESDWTKGTYDRSTGGLHAVVDINEWYFVYPARMYSNVDVFARAMGQGAPGLGVKLAQPNWVEVPDDRTPAIMQGVEQALSRCSPGGVIFVALPSETTETYNVLKKRLCCQAAILSQVLTFSKVLKKDKPMSIATKVVLQVQAKLGGMPWLVKIPMGGVMIVGFDTYHSTFRKGQSVGAMVASIASNCQKYFSIASFHETGQEMSDCISTMLMKAVEAFMRQNGGKGPAKIVFYRDGVGDGQLTQVCNLEVTSILNKLNNRFGPEAPKLAVVVVSKRINTRFFMKENNRFTNPTPGAIVDSVVTLPERYDFYLVPQCTRQGTVTPTAFNVIFDNIPSFKTDMHQILAYKLCHLYYNWSGTVRVPAPCQYAHKLAYLVGENLGTPPVAKLQQTLFYL